MIGNLVRIFRKEYQTLNKIEISKENLLGNFKYLSSINKKISIAPVLKSNAYGHGIVEVAKILDPLNCPFFCVDSLFEAYQFLKMDIQTPVLIMGYTNPENFKVKKLPFSYVAFDLGMLKILNKYQPSCTVHIFVDTGMRREGIRLEDLPGFLSAIKQFRQLTVEGLMSHFASADNMKNPLNSLQVKNFKRAIQIVKQNGFNPRWIHIANSDGLLNYYQKLDFTNLARVGIGLFGISKDPKLKPVLTLKTKIIQIKKLQKGDRVGYGGTYTAKKGLIIGVLPLGYYDGVDYRFSNQAAVIVDKIECPIIGRVSMNITTIDLSKVKNPYTNQEVIVYSDNPNDKNSIENAAKICKTIPYILLVNLAASTKREVVC